MNPFIDLPWLISHLSRINQNLSLHLEQLLTDHWELLSHPALQRGLGTTPWLSADILGVSAKTWGSFRCVLGAVWQMGVWLSPHISPCASHQHQDPGEGRDLKSSPPHKNKVVSLKNEALALRTAVRKPSEEGQSWLGLGSAGINHPRGNCSGGNGSREMGSVCWISVGLTARALAGAEGPQGMLITATAQCRREGKPSPDRPELNPPWAQSRDSSSTVGTARMGQTLLPFLPCQPGPPGTPKTGAPRQQCHSLWGVWGKLQTLH